MRYLVLDMDWRLINDYRPMIHLAMYILAFFVIFGVVAAIIELIHKLFK